MSIFQISFFRIAVEIIVVHFLHRSQYDWYVVNIQRYERSTWRHKPGSKPTTQSPHDYTNKRSLLFHQPKRMDVSKTATNLSYETLLGKPQKVQFFMKHVKQFGRHWTKNSSAFSIVERKFLNKRKFPNCIGAIVGKPVRVKAPAKPGTQYFNNI